MTPDIDTKQYHSMYIHNAKQKFCEYDNILSDVIKQRNKAHKSLEKYSNEIKQIFDIDINKYSSYTDKIYDDKRSLYLLAMRKTAFTNSIRNKSILSYITKYELILYKENRIREKVNLYNKMATINRRNFDDMIRKYYYYAHKEILKGNGYKFGYGIGTYCICRWKRVKTDVTVLDTQATKRNKERLLAAGIKLYNTCEAKWYEARHIPYDGVDYRIFWNDTYYYSQCIIDSNLMGAAIIDFERTIYNKNVRPSYKIYADNNIKCVEDIYNVSCDIYSKMKMLLYKYPATYHNFCRTPGDLKFTVTRRNMAGEEVDEYGNVKNNPSNDYKPKELEYTASNS